ncbi:beta-ketoacyl [acyl carrier protein] synthase domain-containing protein [Corallococcus llansteffanensis]|uniref:Polyketide synthase n=1 Tax=Corallococcus llansteffanensis TaxID=2316731 RepID=A0A3A8Q376_9BACT|nr:polyketide synthase [Corallococcus llansteffanensis]
MIVGGLLHSSGHGYCQGGSLRSLAMLQSPWVRAPPIAITGFAFALPGASSLDELADVLQRGKTTYGVWPADRIAPATYVDPAASVGAAKLYTALGGVIEEGERPEDLAGRSGLAQRWVLDAVHRALASARLSPGSLSGQPVPVFLAHSRGGGHGLYDAAVLALAGRLQPYLVHGAHPSEFTPQELSNVAEQVRRELRDAFGPRFVADPRERAIHRLASGIAENLGTTEKALIVDGNCTGGLVAVELAARELAKGAPWALAGALSYVDTVNQVLYSNARLLSAEGCFPFARKGTGTVISDGVVMLVLTTLERAQKEGLPVHGVIRGVGGGNDGATEGYMLVPNPRGHEVAIQRAIEQAGVSPSELGVLLSHGTGTRAGDAVETKVFNRALKLHGEAGQPRSPVPVLSIKGNVGHAKEASGLANLVALLSMFEAGRIPDPLRDDKDGALIEPGGLIELDKTDRPWPAGDTPRIGGVSAIASGGQNYHAVVEDRPSPARVKTLLRSQPRGPARSDEPIAIVGLAGAFAGAPDLSTLWRNLLQGRRSFRRLSLDQGLSQSARGELYSDHGAPLDLDAERFTGNASQYAERPSDILRYDPLHYLLVDLARSAASKVPIAPGSNVSVVVSAEHCSEYGLRQVAAARLPELEEQLLRALRGTGRDPKGVSRTLRAAMKRLSGDLPELWAGSLFNLSPSFMAARIARAFDLTGPTCAIEAGAAASSIGGLEVACGRLAAREVDAAFWATADMRLGFTRYSDECAMGHLSRRDTPTALDASSDGYLPGEGATVCLLRRLSDAKARGERIHGIIRSIGSAFAPLPDRGLVSETAMSLAIRRAYSRCDVSADDLAFVECFGSGHPGSDVAETTALGRTLAAARARPLPIGGVMPNIGHTGAAAGAASLMKALFMLSTKKAPATVGVRHPLVGTQENLRVVTEPQDLKDARFAGVNAAGAGGTHYHVVIEAGSDALEVSP